MPHRGPCPKPLLAGGGLKGPKTADIAVENGATALRKPAATARSGGGAGGTGACGAGRSGAADGGHGGRGVAPGQGAGRVVGQDAGGRVDGLAGGVGRVRQPVSRRVDRVLAKL